MNIALILHRSKSARWIHCGLLLILVLLAAAKARAQQMVLGIDAGGAAASPWVADADYSGGGTYSVTAAINTANVTNPAPQAVYQTERQGTVTYTIPNLTAGASYTVRLHFAELYWTATGKREFNVAINGAQVLTNFDIVAAAGGADTAVVEPFNATANSSGQIVVAFSNGAADQPLINGIEIDSSCTAPAAASGLTASAASASEVDLSWTASATSGVTYSVYRSTASGFTPSAANQIASGLSGTSYADTGLSASTTYYYVVEAADSCGASAASNQASATTSAASGGNGMVIGINAGGGAVSPWVADEYYGGGGTYSVTATINTANVTNPAPEAVYETERQGAQTYTIPGLTAGAAYTVRLHFAELYWTSPGQREFNVAINGTQVLTNFDIVAAAGGADIAVIEPFNTTANSSGQIIVAFSNGAADQPLINGIEIDGSGGSTAPAAPAGLTATAASSNQINLSWTASTTSGVTYSVFRSTSSGFVPSASNQLASGLTGTSYSDAGLAASTTYYYLVQASDSSGTSSPSNQASATTSAASGGGSAVIEINSGGAAVSGTNWVADEDNSGGGAYSVTAGINTANVTNPAPQAVYQSERQGAETYTIPGLTAGAGYTVRLHFAELYWTTSGKREFNVAINGTQVLTNFDIVAAAGGADTAVVEPFSATANSNGQIVIAFSNGAADQPLINGIEIDTGGSSCTASVPAAPSGLTATAASSTQIDLSWTASTTSGVTYSVFRSTTSGFTPSSSNQVASNLSSTSYTDTGVSASTAYYYVIEAVTCAGAAASATASATTPSPSASTEIVAINSGGLAAGNANGGDASFYADEYYTGGGAATTTAWINTSGITDAAPESVYQSERNGTFNYVIPGLQAGATYTVVLQFAETYWTAAGQRVFNVAINGVTVLSDFDIYAQAGADTALVKEFTTTADGNGQITIAFTDGTADQPKVDGIEVRGPASACTVAPTVAPSGLTAAATSPSIINLSWSGVTPPPNCGISYDVYASTSSGFTPSAATLLAGNVGGTGYSASGLAASTTYYFVVAAADAAGTSPASAPASAATHSATSCVAVPSSAPAGITASAASSNAIQLSWAAIAPPAYCTDVTYNLYGSATSGFTPSLSNQIASDLSGTTFFNTTLPPSSTFYYVVQAADEDGNSPAYSYQVGAQTLAFPAAITATATSANEVDLVWPASTEAAPVIYDIFRGTASGFTPGPSNEIGTTKSNLFNDVVADPATTYYYYVQPTNPAGAYAMLGPVSATTLSLPPSTPPFWDASNIGPTPSGDVMMFKILNRTNGRFPDSQVWWSATINGVTTTNSLANQDTFAMPANASGRMYFYLGPNGTSSPYSDFIEYTIGSTFFNGDTTRVDAFGIPLAIRLTCSDGTDIAVGENAATFAEDRASTFARFIAAVPTQFQGLGQIQAPYAIVNPAAGGFDTGGQYQDYYANYISYIWSTNNLTIPQAGPNGDGLGCCPDLSAAIYRHTAAPNTFNPDGSLISQSMWGNPANFYQQAPADYYAWFWHQNAINLQQYGFPYDDAGGYSSDISCTGPETLLVAVGW